ncbi:DUF1990 family protein [Paractinoplanes durhamensis]|uniref:DUF1990 domain-containing protein n=1 Tax=Paractinoplanes durhamensis TaxID=113563 RepID=A0ABQ3YQE6_9ACTN|nr:DUF1990 domain-containing protein [Actinoplanes durhamensis]GID99807.1 DUF1990 domain-containing protein [Actinoplanes durhamensis]
MRGLTYPEVGATRNDRLPGGYGHVQRDVRVGDGRAAFERAVHGLFSWRMHELAGLTVGGGGGSRAAPGVVVVLRAGWGPLRVTIPCRVVYTVAEAGRRGFAYGTLPGHPEQGEESFLVVLTGAGEVRFRIRAFSRPASLLARAGGPLTRAVQQHVTDRYVKAVRNLASADGGAAE